MHKIITLLGIATPNKITCP